VVGYLVIGAAARLIAGVSELSGGSPQAWIDPPAALISLISLALLWRKPEWFVGIVSAILFVGLVEILAATIVSGGLVPSQMVILWGVVIVLGALISLSVRAAFQWFLAYAVTLVLAVVLPNGSHPWRWKRDLRQGSPSRSWPSRRSSSPAWPTSSVSATGSRRSRTISCTTSSPTRSPRD
jgi:hypothetical protein